MVVTSDKMQAYLDFVLLRIYFDKRWYWPVFSRAKRILFRRRFKREQREYLDARRKCREIFTEARMVIGEDNLPEM